MKYKKTNNKTNITRQIQQDKYNKTNNKQDKYNKTNIKDKLEKKNACPICY